MGRPIRPRQHFGDESLQTNKKLPCRRTAELFCIRDYQQGHGSFAGRKSKGGQEEALHLQQEIDNSELDEHVLSSEALRRALAYLPDIAAADCPVLISGEIGTGTELVARAIHRLSRRSPRAFVRVNCAAIPPHLLAAELFGLQEGNLFPVTQSRPGRLQLAQGGTIFLDGIGELAPETQRTLVGILQEIESAPGGGVRSSQPDARLIAGTSRDLRTATANGTFRKDLFYRLNVFPIQVPPLREQKEDIPTLAEHLLIQYAGKAGKTIPRLDGPAVDLLKSYPWPGNMRELQRVMERFVALWVAGVFSTTAKVIPWESTSPPRTSSLPISEELVPNEKELLEAAMIEMLAVLPGWNLEADGICEWGSL
jgi:transcriptional regulator with GAF, ATPase, and Fis domain